MSLSSGTGTNAGGPPTLPTFAELQARTDGAPAGSSWGVFGKDDEIGTLNLIGPDQTAAGAREVILGQTHSLNWHIDEPAKNAYRKQPKRVHLGEGGDFGRDDYLDRLFLQYSSQWDGLRHICFEGGHFYNGIEASAVDDPDNDSLGIQLWSQRGIAGRGVLVDVARHLESQGVTIDYLSSFEITTEMLDATIAAQGTSIQSGDVLLVRVGWCGWYEKQDADTQVAASRSSTRQPGLRGDSSTAAWLWDHRVSAVAADNMSFEAYPISEGPDGLHRLLIPGLGMPIGEYFWLDGLADACAADRRWSFLFTSAPLNVRGGVGSPPNALAIR
jgi:kynurenine formamidase